MTAAPSPTILPASVWRRRCGAHRERAHAHTGPARSRRDRGLPHPIEDFLFEYYPFPFALLEKWHPGIGITLEQPDARDSSVPPHLRSRFYGGDLGRIGLMPSRLSGKERLRMIRMLDLLIATRDRAPNFACHGLHEWAMVYRGIHVRHEKTLSLRLTQAEIDAVVENRPICCSHHDAFRFFAPAARPLNHLQPSMETREDFEQAGCLHANMDLYKWAAKAMPFVGTELLLDTFELALAARDLDMRASPYDLSEWGREAVRIETAKGRMRYESEQRELATRARPLRQRLIDALCLTLACAGAPGDSDTLPAELLAQGFVE